MPTLVGDTDSMTTAPTTVTIAGREYLLHTDDIREMAFGQTVMRITGKRGAEGALIIHDEPEYEGRALVVGIAALERLNWWDISRAIAHLFPTCATAVAR